MKTCNKCGVEKDTTEFSRKGTGLQPYCKVCAKARYLANREKDLQYHKAWHRANRELQKRNENPERLINENL